MPPHLGCCFYNCALHPSGIISGDPLSHFAGEEVASEISCGCPEVTHSLFKDVVWESYSSNPQWSYITPIKVGSQSMETLAECCWGNIASKAQGPCLPAHSRHGRRMLRKGLWRRWWRSRDQETVQGLSVAGREARKEEG